MSGSGSTTRTAPPISGKAIWSLVLGIASVVLVFGCGLLTGIPAVVLGFSAKRDVALSGGAERGRGIAIAGIVTGVVGMLVSALFLLAVGAGIWSSHDDSAAPPWKPPTASTHIDKRDLKPFYTQQVRWSDCGGGKCARVKVPVDYEKPKGQTLRLAVKVIPSTGAGGHSLFLNPGGPGASGFELADYLATKISPEVRKQYDLVNVDPRGVGDSEPIDCLSDRAFETWAAGDPDPDTPEEVAEFRADTRRFGKGCLKRSGKLAAHVSTEEVARDFDVLRALFGREKLDWFGFSYGTQIGATYATLFPNRVGRMVLDGPVDSSLSTIDASLAQAVGFQDALDAYVRSCTSAMWCPLGRDETKGGRKIVSFLARVDQHPLRTDDGSRRLTEGLAFYGIVKPLYSEATWPTLTQALDAAFDGDGSVLMRLADSYFQDANGEAFRVVSCLDQRDVVTPEDVEEAEPRFRKASPAFGPALAWGTLGCTDWPVKPDHPQIDIYPHTKAPILIVGATRDPATPYAGAKALAQQIPSSVLLTRRGGGHTSYASGDTCIDAAVNAYLIAGTMPAKGTVCR
ncbi:MAG: alpha/beta fold hydrolase [Aeromicrobium sp.]